MMIIGKILISFIYTGYSRNLWYFRIKAIFEGISINAEAVLEFCHRLRPQKDLSGCHSWKLRTRWQSSVWLSKKLWRQQERKDFKGCYSSSKSEVVSLFKNTRLSRILGGHVLAFAFLFLYLILFIHLGENNSDELKL